MTPLVTRMAKLVHNPEDGMWFDMGDNAQRPPYGHVPDAEMLSLPYPMCFVACSQFDGSALVLRLQTTVTGESMSITGIVVGHGDTWRNAIEPFLVTRTDAGLQISDIDGGEPTEYSEYRTALQHVEDFLLSLRTDQSAYKPTARPSLINSKRAAKGKGPVLFDWHTVAIKPMPAKGDYQGGSHASPRLHDRRGHWRKYPSGKVGWVKNCKVGDASRGVVFKDYEVKE